MVNTQAGAHRPTDPHAPDGRADQAALHARHSVAASAPPQLSARNQSTRGPGSKAPAPRPSTARAAARSQEGPISIVVVDFALVADGIGCLLATEPAFDVVGQGNHGDDASVLARQHRPDVLLLEVALPGPPPTVAIPRIHQACPQTRVVVVSATEDPNLLQEVIAVGARAYVAKSVSRDQLFDTIRAAVRDGNHTIIAASGVELELLRRQPGGEQDRSLLTSRENDVLQLVAQALTNDQIAQQLYVATSTVKRHLTIIYRKLGATSRLDAINRADAARLLTATDNVIYLEVSPSEGGRRDSKQPGQ